MLSPPVLTHKSLRRFLFVKLYLHVIIYQATPVEGATKLLFYVPLNSQSQIGTGPQHCHLWGSYPLRDDSL